MTTVISGTTGVDRVAASAVSQADLASNVVGNGPAFSVVSTGGQTVTSASYTKVNLQTEEFDTNNNFDTTLSRFTPTVAGYYQINGVVFVSTTATGVEAVIYKNGAAVKYGSYTNTSSAGTVSQVSAIIYLNGTTDYAELFVLATGTTPSVGTSTAFNGCLVRSSNILLDGGIPVTNNGLYVDEPLTGFKNYLINGGATVAQRGNAAIAVSTWVYGGADRICVATDGTTASGTIQRYSGVATTTGYAQGALVTTTGAGGIYFQQRIETVNTLGLNGKTITVSATVFQNTGSTQNVGLILRKPTTTQDTWAAYSNIFTSSTVSIPSGVPTPVSWTYTLGATDASLGLGPIISFASIGAVTAKDFWVGDFQLEKGSVPTRFDFRPYNVELAACQRYYQVIPVNSLCSYGYGGAGTYCGTATYVFPVTMYKAGTVTAPTWATLNITSTTLEIVNANSISYRSISTALAGCYFYSSSVATVNSEI